MSVSHQETEIIWGIPAANIKPMPFLVLLMIAYRIDAETGRCDPSINVIADDCKMSRRACIDALNWLEENGFIKRISRQWCGRPLSNEYELGKSCFRRGARA